MDLEKNSPPNEIPPKMCSKASIPSISSSMTTTSTSEMNSELRQNCRHSLRERENGLSYVEILVNFLKGMIGPGCLSLPLAFKQAGLWTGLSLVFIFGFLNCICMLKLVKCAHLLSSRKGNSFLNYGNMAQEAVLSSFRPFRRHSKAAKIFVNASIVTLQMGVCSVFYVFCSVHIKEFFDEFIHGPGIPQPSVIEWMLILYVPFVLLNFVRNLRPIAVLSTIGNLLCICSLFFIFQHLLRNENHNFALPTFTNFNGVMAASGSILYSFEGQAMVLPLENRLKRPKQILGPFGILSVGLAIVSTVYASSGFLGYISFGQNVRGSITLNLPQKETEFSLLRLALTLVIYLGFVIQMYVIVDMLWPELAKKLEKNANKNLKQNKFRIELLFRAFLVGIAMTFAIAVPNLEEMIPLVGVTTGMLLAFVIPSLLDLLTWLPIHLEEGRNYAAIWLIFEDLSLAGVGIFGLIAGLRANLNIIFGGENNFE